MTKRGSASPERIIQTVVTGKSEPRAKQVYAYTSAGLIINATSRASNFASGRGLGYVRLDIRPLRAHLGELTIWRLATRNWFGWRMRVKSPPFSSAARREAGLLLSGCSEAKRWLCRVRGRCRQSADVVTSFEFRMRTKLADRVSHRPRRGPDPGRFSEERQDDAAPHYRPL